MIATVVAEKAYLSVVAAFDQGQPVILQSEKRFIAI